MNNGEEFSPTFDDLVDEYLSIIECVSPDGPYRLMGWSIGGLIAHAIAARIEGQGRVVESLILIGSQPPVQISDELTFEIGENAGFQYSESVPGAIQDRMRLFTAHILDITNGVRLVKTTCSAAYIRSNQEMNDATHLDIWRPLLGEDIDVLDVDCDHHDMFDSEILRKTGPFISRKMGCHLKRGRGFPK